MIAQIIVYRSKSEQYRDEFFNDILFPWMYENWWMILVGLVAVFILNEWYKSRNNYR